jgi:hypothetical protein
MTSVLRGSVLACALGALCLSVPALAQTPDKDSRSISEFSVATMDPVFKDLGIKYEVGDDGKSTPYMTFSYDDLKMVLYPTACEKDTFKKCVGAVLIATWEPYKDVSRAEMLERINAFDINYDYVDAALDENGAPLFSRYWIADHGMNYGNIRVELNAFGNLANKFSETIDKPVQAKEPAMLPVEAK